MIMSSSSRPDSGRESARDVPVWDPLVRLLHWSLALAILLNGAVVDDESAAHEWIGYAALAMVAVRLVWALIGPRAARFSAFPPNPAAALRHVRGILRGDHGATLSHNPLGAFMVYNLWLTVIALGLTGYMMTTLQFFGVEWVEDAHEAAFAWLMLSVALHVAGVLFDSRWTGVGLVRAMITGRKRMTGDVPDR
jgi:cytochrome b